MEQNKIKVDNLNKAGLTSNSVYMFLNNETDELYIGSTNNLVNRFKKHYGGLKNGTHFNSKFQKAFDNNSNFDLYSLPLATRDDAYDLEDKLIKDHWGNPKLLNISFDVDANRHNAVVSDETKHKQRESMLMFYSNGGKNPFDGKSHSDETKALLKEKSIVQFSNQAARDNMSVKTKERFSTQESRDLVSQRTKLAMADPDIRKKMSEAAKSRISNPDFIDKYCKKVLVDGVIYNSASECASYVNVSKPVVSDRIRSTSDKFKKWEYLNEPKHTN